MSGVMTELQINNEENDGATSFGQLDIYCVVPLH